MSQTNKRQGQCIVTNTGMMVIKVNTSVVCEALFYVF